MRRVSASAVVKLPRMRLGRQIALHCPHMSVLNHDEPVVCGNFWKRCRFPSGPIS